MANCTMCTKFDECPWRSDPESLCSAYEQKTMTNADKIRAMDDEDLALFLAGTQARIDLLSRKVKVPLVDALKCLAYLKREAE